MNTLDAHPVLPLLVGAVRSASRLCRAVQADLVEAGEIRKDDRSPVTVADFGSQALVSERLREARPEIPLVGEEDAAALRLEEYASVRERVVTRVAEERPGWAEDAVLAAIDRGAAPCPETGPCFVLDPIDGTKGFLRGDQYAVALGYLEDGELVAAALGCPNLPDPDGRGCVLAAARGAGAGRLSLDDADLTPRPIRATGLTDPAAARVCESVEKAHSNKGWSGDVVNALGITVPKVPVDSQCKYALVARGDAEIYLRLPTRPDYVEKIWDHAAGALVVLEAGGRVTDVDGKPLDFGHGRRLETNRGVVATNGPIHDAVLAAIRETEPRG
jgi:HAL2 family 3'(2'),5'-bisphosphate nucleotidase